MPHNLTLIVATDLNGAIGKDNKLLWHLPNDLKHFKTLTNGSIIIMGRKTFESLPFVLPNRKHLIITRQEDYKVPPNVEVFNNLQSVLDYIKDMPAFVIGGADIYKQMEGYCNRMELTKVHTTIPDADAYFNPNTTLWQITNEETHQRDTNHEFNYSFISAIKRV